MNLKKKIKTKLLETKEKKGRLLTEKKIVENRIKFIIESSSIKTKKNLDDIFLNILLEMVYLHKQEFNEKMIAESVDDVFDVLGTVFGGSKTTVLELFKERGVRFILEKLGLEDNDILKSYLSTSLNETDLKDVPKLFTDCGFLSRKISNCIPMAYLEKLDYERQMGGEFMQIVRGALKDVIEDSDFADKINDRITRVICPIVDMMDDKFNSQMESMKSSLVPKGMDNQS